MYYLGTHYPSFIKILLVLRPEKKSLINPYPRYPFGKKKSRLIPLAGYVLTFTFARLSCSTFFFFFLKEEKPIVANPSIKGVEGCKRRLNSSQKLYSVSGAVVWKKRKKKKNRLGIMLRSLEIRFFFPLMMNNVSFFS